MWVSNRTKRFVFLCLFAFAGIASLLTAPSAHADTAASSPERKNETLISAKQMTSDQETGIIKALGNVEIVHGDYILHADKVTYNQKTGVMHAEGHVALLSPTGEVQFAHEEEITGDMKQAFAENISILFPDSSRMAGKTIQRYEGRWTVADHGMYTACNVCKEDPDNPPLWQMRADKIVHDNATHDIYYHDATVDFAGLPVLYTPYLSMPDPTVDRRQGLLTPTPGVNPNIGTFVRVPYYFDISPDKDATIMPTFSTKDKLQLGGEYRERFDQGILQLDGSFTHADLISDAGANEGYQWRGDLFGHFLYNIDNVWRAGSEVAFASDKSYLQRYNIQGASDELTNRVYLEGFQGRDYSVVNSYYFEDLRPGTQPVEPLVLPQVSFSALGEPGQSLGGRWSFDGGMLVTTRDNKNQGLNQQGPDTRRLTMNGGWERRFVSDTGLVTTLSGLLRTDAYSADNVINPVNPNITYNNVLAARQFEQANVVASYPIARRGDGYNQMIEPIVSFTAAPAYKNPSDIPIEDSLDVEFDETNLFSPNRFTGDDLIEGGSRATYGLRHDVTTDDGMRVDMFGGQSYDFSRNSDFSQFSGLQDKISDYVGRIDFIPAKWLNFNYGARLSHSTFTPQQQDATLSFGAPLFRPSLQYISAYQLDPNTSLIDQLQEATIGFTSTFAKYWTLSAAHTQAFEPEPGPRDSSLSLNYGDECLSAGVSTAYNNTDRADISSGFSVIFHVYLRNVGGIHTDSGTTNTNTFPTEFRQN
jgi:LPS-assembly protein